MYKALRDAQSDINVALLKLVDTISGVSESRTSRTDVREKDCDLEEIRNSIAFLNQKQNAQFDSLVQEMKGLKENMDNILKFIMVKGAINTETTIPVIQPSSQESDFKHVFISSNSGEECAPATPETSAVVNEQDQAPDSPVTPNTPVDLEEQVDVEETEEVEVEETEEVEVEEQVEVEETEEQVEAEEETLEVEEWTYKGRVFFKDSVNTVYANNAGEIGDPMGQYDPIKNIVKKLPTN